MMRGAGRTIMFMATKDQSRVTLDYVSSLCTRLQSVALSRQLKVLIELRFDCTQLLFWPPTFFLSLIVHVGRNRPITYTSPGALSM